MTLCCFVVRFCSKSCDCAMSGISLTQHHLDALYFPHLWLPHPPPSVLSIQTNVKGKPCESGNKRSQSIPSPPVHLHILSQLLNTLKLITVRGTSIHIQLSSGLEIKWPLKQTPGLRVTAEMCKTLLSFLYIHCKSYFLCKRNKQNRFKRMLSLNTRTLLFRNIFDHKIEGLLQIRMMTMMI